MLKDKLFFISKVKIQNKQLKQQAPVMNKIMNPDQLTALGRKSTRGMAWSSEIMKKALRLKFSCGSTGYDVLRETGIPLPSARTLRRRLQNVNFSSGILTAVLDLLKLKVCLLFI